VKCFQSGIMAHRGVLMTMPLQLVPQEMCGLRSCRTCTESGWWWRCADWSWRHRSRIKHHHSTKATLDPSSLI